ncbi:hypothetical protein BGZ61DRAFT_451205 [Ilyonectria robusta]|uniref:uncharacterized protein n=1 Tax=Ilyonectria robusta TaxID=1079257 RepID=UPI001E8D94EB|nr:uncharacterized protein BGZ61DRAFT_451205 [Ilyonectria robusta]KAH8699725.1 hypothetical protein BGZ61DRAFT_451205 [Ilyonectria robusta]
MSKWVAFWYDARLAAPPPPLTTGPWSARVDKRHGSGSRGRGGVARVNAILSPTYGVRATLLFSPSVFNAQVSPYRPHIRLPSPRHASPALCIVPEWPSGRRGMGWHGLARGCAPPLQSLSESPSSISCAGTRQQNAHHPSVHSQPPEFHWQSRVWVAATCIAVSTRHLASSSDAPRSSTVHVERTPKIASEKERR